MQLDGLADPGPCECEQLGRRVDSDYLGSSLAELGEVEAGPAAQLGEVETAHVTTQVQHRGTVVVHVVEAVRELLFEARRHVVVDGDHIGARRRVARAARLDDLRQLRAGRPSGRLAREEVGAEVEDRVAADLVVDVRGARHVAERSGDAKHLLPVAATLKAGKVERLDDV